MRKILLIITAVLIHFSSYSQIDTTINLIPNWEKGEIKKYEIKTYSSIDAEGEKKVNSLTRKMVIIQIFDINGKLLELNWRTEQLIFSDTINSDNPFTELMNTLDKDVSIKYTINKKGVIQKVINIDEISKIIKLRVDSVLNTYIENNSIEKSEAERLRFQFSMMFSSDEQIKTLVLNDIYKFHQIYGYSFTTDKTTIIPDNIFSPNPNRESSNNLILKFTSFDKNKIGSIEGELKSAEKNKKLRESIEKDRSVKKTYEFKSPENWLISHKSIMNGSGYVNFSNTYEINLIE